MTKEKTAYVFPNAIQITTNSDKYTFSSFIQRDTSYQVIFRLWQNSLLNFVSLRMPHCCCVVILICVYVCMYLLHLCMCTTIYLLLKYYTACIDIRICTYVCAHIPTYIRMYMDLLHTVLYIQYVCMCTCIFCSQCLLLTSMW